MINCMCWLRGTFPWGAPCYTTLVSPERLSLHTASGCYRDASTPVYWVLTLCQALLDTLHTSHLMCAAIRWRSLVEAGMGWRPSLPDFQIGMLVSSPSAPPQGF